MYNRTDGNAKKQSPLNYGNDKHESNPVPPKSREQTRTPTVRQADNQDSCISKNNPPPAHCSSIVVQQRAIEPKQFPAPPPPPDINETIDSDLNETIDQEFNALLAPKRFIDMERKYHTFHDDYNGIPHSEYARLVRIFVCDNPYFKTEQLNRLLLVLNIHDQKPSIGWHWRSLATAFYAWTCIGLFTPNNNLSPNAKVTQENILKGFLGYIIERHKKKNSLPGITARCVANLLSAITALVEKGMTLAKHPTLKEVTIILWLHVKIKASVESKNKEYNFNLQEVTKLLWVMGILGSHVLPDLENAQNLKDTVIVLLTLMETKLQSKANEDIPKPQDVAYAMHSIPQMIICHLLQDAPKINTSVALLLPLIVKHKDRFFAQVLFNVIWALAELGGGAWLNMKNMQNLKCTVAILSPFIKSAIESREDKNRVNVQEVACALRAITKLAACNILDNKTVLTTLVFVLWPLVTTFKNLLTTSGLSNILWATANLGDGLLEPKDTKKLEKTVLKLLLLFIAKTESEAERVHFNALGILSQMWSILKIMETRLPLDPIRFNKLMAFMLPFAAEKKNLFNALSLKNNLWCMAKLMEIGMNNCNRNMITAIVFMLLPIIKTKVELQEDNDRFSMESIINILWAIAKLVHYINTLNTPNLKHLVATLLTYVDTHNQQLSTHSIANLLWVLATFGELVETQRAVTLSISLINEIDTYKGFTKSAKMMSIWSLLVCSSRLSLSGSTDRSGIIHTHIENILLHIKNDLLDTLTLHDEIIIIQASSWLGKPCSNYPRYLSTTSLYQSTICQELRKKFSSLTIKEEQILHALPPVDIYLPDQNIVIEVQGPTHYVGNDAKTRNGATLLKIALLKNLGYDIIEIRMSEHSQNYSAESMQECIDKIQKKIKNDDCSVSPISDTCQNPSETESLTASENNDSSFSDTAFSTETSWTKITRRKKRHRLKNFSLGS